MSQGTTQPEYDDHQALSYEATTSESYFKPRVDVPAPVIMEPNRWCGDDQSHVYKYAQMFNEKRVMTMLVRVECCVFTGNFHTVLDVYIFFSWHKLEWTNRGMGT